MHKRTIRLTTEAYLQRPALDTAVSRSLLLNVADGKEPETLRLHRPSAIVAFGRQDSRSPGYAAAVRAARENGFEAVQRLVGGKAAVFHEDTLAFAWAIPNRQPREGVKARFEEVAGIMEDSFKRLGVDARVGEIPGEYCPGAYSVNARGMKKLMGVGQRLVPSAAHVGGVVVVNGRSRVRDVLLPVYRHLGFDWDPETAGSIGDEVGAVTYHDVQQAIIDAFSARYDLEEAPLSAETVELAGRLEPDHVVP